MQHLTALTPESLGGLTGEELLQLAREQLRKLRPEEVAGLLRERTLGDIRAELQAAEDRAAAEKTESEQRARDEMEERRRHTFVPDQEYTADALRELLLRQAALKAASSRTSTAKAETGGHKQPQPPVEAKASSGPSKESSGAGSGAIAKAQHSAAPGVTRTGTDHGKRPGDDTQQPTAATATVTQPEADSGPQPAKRIKLRRMGNSSGNTTPVTPNQELSAAPAAVEAPAVGDITTPTNAAGSEKIVTELSAVATDVDPPAAGASTKQAARDLGGIEEQVAGQLPGKGRKVCIRRTSRGDRREYMGYGAGGCACFLSHRVPGMWLCLFLLLTYVFANYGTLAAHSLGVLTYMCFSF